MERVRMACRLRLDTFPPSRRLGFTMAFRDDMLSAAIFDGASRRHDVTPVRHIDDTPSLKRARASSDFSPHKRNAIAISILTAFEGGCFFTATLFPPSFYADLFSRGRAYDDAARHGIIEDECNIFLILAAFLAFRYRVHAGRRFPGVPTQARFRFMELLLDFDAHAEWAPSAAMPIRPTEEVDSNASLEL